MIQRPAMPGGAARVEVSSVVLLTQEHPGIAAFNLDAPRTGDETPGRGIEVTGWVIGRDAPVCGVRVTSGGHAGPLIDLVIRRPDVAAAYPAIAHGSISGFSAWVALEPFAGATEVIVEAILANDAAVTLATIAARPVAAERAFTPGARPVTAPDFAIIGTQRGGTTSLYAYLQHHPRIAPPASKELHFFSDGYARGLDWYLGQFPAALPPGTLTGEATPYYLFHPQVPRRLRAAAPRAKLIALLRNPVDRAYSHHALEYSRGDEWLDFEAALAAEPERLAGEEERLALDPTYVSWAHKHYSYLSRGNYARQLERWFAVFPRDQILVMCSEDLYQRTGESVARVTSFLGLEATPPVPFAVHNQSAGPPLDPTLRRRLSRHFTPLNAHLAEMLGWDPGWD